MLRSTLVFTVCAVIALGCTTKDDDAETTETGNSSSEDESGDGDGDGDLCHFCCTVTWLIGDTELGTTVYDYPDGTCDPFEIVETCGDQQAVDPDRPAEATSYQCECESYAASQNGSECGGTIV